MEKLRSALRQCGVTVPAAALLAALSAHGATSAPATLVTAVTTSALASSAAVKPSLSGLVKGALMLMTWNKAKIALGTLVLLLLLGGGSLAIWKRPSPALVGVALQSFEPMAGEWEGTFTLARDGNILMDGEACSMSVVTQRGGRSCEIELRCRRADGQLMVQHYTHSINERGDRLFTTSDPHSGRGDGEGNVTESFYNSATGEWRAAMRFPLPGARGVMDGSWERRGDTLVVRSHDEFYGARGSSHVHAELQLQRRVGASASP